MSKNRENMVENLKPEISGLNPIVITNSATGEAAIRELQCEKRQSDDPLRPSR
jgi:hypothetical protein